MVDVTERLTACFATVFPKLEASRITAASVQDVPEWDSVAQVNLLSVIGEEFGMEIDFDEFEDATSFRAIAERLHEKAHD